MQISSITSLTSTSRVVWAEELVILGGSIIYIYICMYISETPTKECRNVGTIYPHIW